MWHLGRGAIVLTRFFFDRVGSSRTDRDTVGASFTDLEAAYLDAYESALEVSVEMLRRRENPIGGRLEIRDEQGRLLMEVPFAEVLRPGAGADHHLDNPARERLRASMARGRELKADLTSALATAKTSIELARATLNRPQVEWGSGVQNA